jgi:hypothetical protein
VGHVLDVPLEPELHELIRTKGLADPDALRSGVSGREPTADERINIAWRMNMTLMEALLLLAQRLDECGEHD